MDKIQNQLSKILILLLLNAGCMNAMAQPVPLNGLLSRADSLFEQQRYIQALSLYETILEKEQVSSPEMFLKMAFIEEGLSNYINTLYYLDCYYKLSLDENALRKMEQVASAHKITGYQ